MLRKDLIYAYVLLVGIPLLALLAILHGGTSLVAPPGAPPAPYSPISSFPAPLNLLKLVLQIGVILVFSRTAGVLFKHIGQPQVIGEMVAGILLGPSLLGWTAPGISAALFPAASLGY